MAARRLAGQMLMELWMEEEENMRKAEEFKIRRRVMICNIPRYLSRPPAFLFSSR